SGLAGMPSTGTSSGPGETAAARVSVAGVAGFGEPDCGTVLPDVSAKTTAQASTNRAPANKIRFRVIAITEPRGRVTRGERVAFRLISGGLPASRAAPPATRATHP